MKKIRADILLVERGLCASRAEAQKAVMAGLVRLSADDVLDKPGRLLSADCEIVLQEPFPYVSRGALKLLGALEQFHPELSGAVALDIGASTGGFTDVLLQHGVARVYAVDVGYGQLHYKLRNDPRVVLLERTNARYLTSREIPEAVDVLVGDVSFISLEKVLPACAPLLKPGGWVFVLVKPQFEAGRADVGKGGVVRDPEVRRACVSRVCEFAESRFGWRLSGVVESPVTGPKGNVEYIAAFRGTDGGAGCSVETQGRTVDCPHPHGDE